MNDFDVKKLIINCLDYTSLNDTDTEDTIRTLCDRAITPLGHVAAVCVYPDFVKLAHLQLQNTGIHIATVVNFPRGSENLDDILTDTKAALFEGADEIDVVLPYESYLNGDRENAIRVIYAVKKTCGDKIVKVILETGELNTAEMIRGASTDALSAGADFLKTSTGKVAVGATPEAAIVMLKAIKKYQPKTEKTLGLKISGGIRTEQDAAQYIELARSIMGENWVSPHTFRIGASSLLANLLGDSTTNKCY